MTLHALNLVAVVSLASCWGAFLLTWLVTAIFFESRAPAERKSSWYGSLQIGGVIVVIVSAAVPAHDWRAVDEFLKSTPVELSGFTVREARKNFEALEKRDRARRSRKPGNK